MVLARVMVLACVMVLSCVMVLACVMVLTHVTPCYATVAWVTRPERPKGVKDEVTQARSRSPEVPLDLYIDIIGSEGVI